MLLLGVALVLGACSDDEGSSGDSGSSTSAQTETTTEAEREDSDAKSKNDSSKDDDKSKDDKSGDDKSKTTGDPTIDPKVAGSKPPKETGGKETFPEGGSVGDGISSKPPANDYEAAPVAKSLRKLARTICSSYLPIIIRRQIRQDKLDLERYARRYSSAYKGDKRKDAYDGCLAGLKDVQKQTRS